MKNIILLVVVMLFFGCEVNTKTSIDRINSVIYVKDERTGVCFAGWAYGRGIDFRTLTYVPCTEEVERLLINKKGDDTCH